MLRKPITHVVILDPSVPDLRTLLDGLDPGGRAYVLDAGRCGIEQVAQILAREGHRDLQAISLVGHGRPGAIRLGATNLDADALGGASAGLDAIGRTLAPTGSLLLYACDLGRGEEGIRFLDDLSRHVAGAPVAAASHVVGSLDHGGSWDLDQVVGLSATAVSAPFTMAALASFQGALAFSQTESFTIDTGGGTVVQTFGLPNGDVAVASHLSGGAADNQTLRIFTPTGTLVSTIDIAALATSKVGTSEDYSYGALSNGDFVVAYNKGDSGQSGTDGVYFRIIHADGTASTSEAQINTSDPLPAGINRGVEIAQLSNGNIAFTWQRSDDETHGTRVFGTNGAAVTSEVDFGTTQDFSPVNVTIAANSAGTYTVTYNDKSDVIEKVYNNDASLKSTTLIPLSVDASNGGSIFASAATLTSGKDAVFAYYMPSGGSTALPVYLFDPTAGTYTGPVSSGPIAPNLDVAAGFALLSSGGGYVVAGSNSTNDYLNYYSNTGSLISTVNTDTVSTNTDFRVASGYSSGIIVLNDETNGSKVIKLFDVPNSGPGTPTANPQSDAVGFDTAKAITLTGSDPDTPALPLTYTVVTGPAHGTLSGTGPNLTYTPTAGYHGADSFTFTDNNGTNTSSAATVSLTVAAGTPTAIAQSDAVGHDTAKGITLTGSDPDSPAVPLTYLITTSPTHGTLSGFNASTGAVTYTPTAGYQGADSFTFTDNNGTNTSSAATVSLTIGAGTPTADAQSDAVGFDTAKAITLTGSDPDIPALSLTYAVVTGPTHGTLSGTGPNLTYTPTAGYQGADSFTFTDDNGANTSSAATVSLTVAAGTPTANAQSDAVGFDTATAITLTGSDPDNPAIALTYSVVTGPTHGMLSGNGANLTYTPTAGYHGADSFTFTDSNGTNTSSAATVSFTVAAGTPTANAQSDSVGHDTAIAIMLTGSDPDTPPLALTYTVATGPTHGTLSGSGANLTYTPTAGYQGVDSFTFTDSNGSNTSSAATVSIDVAPAPPPTPVLANDTGSSATDKITNDAAITYATPAAGDVLLYSLDGAAYTSTAPTVAGDGSHTVSVEERDAAGNVSGASGLTFTLDTSADLGTAAALAVNDTADHVINAAEAHAVAYTVSGLDTDATAVASFTDGLHSVTAAVAANGTFSVDLSALTGAVTSSLAITDTAGNTASATGNPVALSTIAPTLAITGVSGATNLVDGHVISGTVDAADAGALITIRDATQVIGTTLSDGTGHWSLGFTDSDGGTSHAYHFTASATDTAGDTGTSAPFNFTLDFSPNLSEFGTVTQDIGSLGGQVYALYDGLLGRAADPIGIEGWVAHLVAGESLHDVALSFLSSDEYTQRFGSYTAGSDDSFVQHLYTTALGRSADPAGEAYWDAQLASGVSRVDAALEFALSSENQQQIAPAVSAGIFVADPVDSSIARLYEGVLHRAPDGPGLQGWENAVHNGTSLTTVAQDFIGSAEYQLLHPAPQTDAQFIDSLYQGAVGRSAEPGGASYFSGLLAQGATRADIALDIVQSTEAQIHLAGQIEGGWHLT